MSIIQCHYEINVARLIKGPGSVVRGGSATRYEHLFATDMRSCVTREQMKCVYTEIKARFPEPEFEVTVSQIDCYGKDVTP